MNFHEVNAHVESLDLSPYYELKDAEFEEPSLISKQFNKATTGRAAEEAKPSELLTNEPLAVLGKVCEVYQKVRPILQFVGGFWLIPAKWREAVKVLMNTLDGICPQQ